MLAVKPDRVRFTEDQARGWRGVISVELKAVVASIFGIEEGSDRGGGFGLSDM